MFFFRRKSKLPKVLSSLSAQEISALTPEQRNQFDAELLKKLHQRLDNDPEATWKFTKDFREMLDNLENKVTPEIRKEYEKALTEMDEEANTFTAYVFMVMTKRDIEAWEKQKVPPMRDIIRRENDLKEIIVALDAIPKRYRVKARADLEFVLNQVQKLQE